MIKPDDLCGLTPKTIALAAGSRTSAVGWTGFGEGGLMGSR
jgi:hypothetical protein